MRQPSYNDGYHSPQSGFKGKNPNLWDGCVIAMDPGLGNTGAVLFDHSGYANHGTIVGDLSLKWVTNDCGICLDFPDTGDYVNIPYSETFASQCYSWSIWVKSTETGGNLGLISRWQNVGGTYSWVVTWEGAGGIYWYQAGLTQVSGTTVVVNDGKWHHLCGTYDKTAAKLYCDGIEKHSVANTGNYTATTQPLVLGTYATSQDWDGQLRAFAFWNRGLSPGEVRELASDPAAMYQVGKNSQRYLVLNAYLLTADYGSYSLTGQAANLLYGRTLLATNGSYTLSGQDAGLVSTRLLACDYGSYSLSGQDAGLNRGFTMTADQGSYTLTGHDSGLLATRTITAAQGSYLLSGQAAGLLATRQITAAQGSYTLSGQAANLLKSTVITADVGSFAVNGQAASLNRGYAMVAGSGSYALNGQDAGFNRTYVVACDYGSYSVNGQDAGLAYGRILTSDVGSFTLTGIDARLYSYVFDINIDTTSEFKARVRLQEFVATNRTTEAKARMRTTEFIARGTA